MFPKIDSSKSNSKYRLMFGPPPTLLLSDGKAGFEPKRLETSFSVRFLIEDFPLVFLMFALVEFASFRSNFTSMSFFNLPILAFFAVWEIISSHFFLLSVVHFDKNNKISEAAKYLKFVSLLAASCFLIDGLADSSLTFFCASLCLAKVSMLILGLQTLFFNAPKTRALFYSHVSVAALQSIGWLISTLVPKFRIAFFFWNLLAAVLFDELCVHQLSVNSYQLKSRFVMITELGVISSFLGLIAGFSIQKSSNVLALVALALVLLVITHLYIKSAERFVSSFYLYASSILSSSGKFRRILAVSCFFIIYGFIFSVGALKVLYYDSSAKSTAASLDAVALFCFSLAILLCALDVLRLVFFIIPESQRNVASPLHVDHKRIWAFRCVAIVLLIIQPAIGMMLSPLVNIFFALGCLLVHVSADLYSVSNNDLSESQDSLELNNRSNSVVAMKIAPGSKSFDEASNQLLPKKQFKFPKYLEA